MLRGVVRDWLIKVRSFWLSNRNEDSCECGLRSSLGSSKQSWIIIELVVGGLVLLFESRSCGDGDGVFD